MAKKKKFFNTKVKNRRKKMIKLIIIGAVALVIVACIGLFFIIRNASNKAPEKLLIRQTLSAEINETVTDEMFFTTKNPNLETVKIKYPDNYDNTKIGSYEVVITVGEKDYKTKLNIVDTTAPVLVLKDVVLKSFKFYTFNDFVESCTDNSGLECTISFLDSAKNEDGDIIDYSKFMKAGTYEIKVSATDASGNSTVKTTKLTIGKEPTAETPATCEYGTSEFNESLYVMASSVATNGCALNTSLYNDESLAQNINKMLATETIRIKKDIDKLKLDGTLALNRTINVILNKDEKGMVGYELLFTVKVTKNEKSETVVEYKVNSDGNRIFITNPHNLAS